MKPGDATKTTSTDQQNHKKQRQYLETIKAQTLYHLATAEYYNYKNYKQNW